MNIILLRRRSVFFVGFIFGFISVFILKHVGYIFESPELHKDSSKAVWNLVQKWSEESENYEAWRYHQRVRISKVDLDALAYGPQFNQNLDNGKISLENEWLKHKVSITCVVFVEKLKRAATIKDTWGAHCNQLLFFSRHLSDVDLSVMNLGIKYTSSWQLLCESMNYIWKNNKGIPLDWIIFINDDTFVIPENLRYMLAPLDFREPHYLGHAVALWGLPYNVAQSGYVLSHEALRRLITMFDTSEKCTAGGKYWKMEDYYLGKHLASLGIHPSDTRDAKQRGTFHGYPLFTLLGGVAKPGSYYTRALYPPGPECCSNRTVTFNVGDPDKMRTIHYILYHMHIFNSTGVCGSKPAPTPIPENEVWRKALLDEFNLTVIEEISSQKYFEIWRTKYSEPELFIDRNFRNMPEVLKSMRDAYNSQTKRSLDKTSL